MLWLKAFHLISMVAWFAGLFYLPRLFVYHAQASDDISIDRFKVMERKLYFGIMTPAGILTLILGLLMLVFYAWSAFGAMLWLQLKLMFLILLIGYHLYCGRLVRLFAQDKNQRSHRFYRWFNEVPVIFLILIVLLATFRPA